MKLEELINESYEQLNDSDLFIWKYINNNRESCSNMTIEEMASKCSVSRTTILRFAKKIGFQGYSELKYSIRNSLREGERFAVRQINIDKMVDQYTNILEELKNKDFTVYNEMIENARNIYVVGTGTVQKIIARDMQRLFLDIGIFIHVIEGVAEINKTTEFLSSEDLIFIISLSGEREDFLKIARKLRVKNVPMISITSLAVNSLAKYSTANLYLSINSLPFGKGKFHTNIMAFYLIVEFLFVKYVNYIERKLSSSNLKNS